MIKASPPRDIREKLAIELLKKKGVILVNKATRVGVTTSILKCAKELGKKVTFVEPYLKIIEEQIEKYAEKGIKINSFRKNRIMCPRVEKLCKDEPWRNAIMKCQYIPADCPQCMKKKETNCLYKELMTKDWDILGLTYSKYKFLNDPIKNKIKDSDIFLFDEITTFLDSDVNPIIYRENDINYFIKKFKTSLKGIKGELFKPSFQEFLNRGEKYKDEIEKSLFEMMWTELFFLCNYIDYSVKKALESPMKTNKSGIRKVIGIINLKEKTSEVCKFWIENKGYIRNILERYAKIEKFPIKYLDELLGLYCKDYLLIEKEKGNISIKSLMVDYDAFETFFSFFNPKKQLLIISDAGMPSILDALLYKIEHKTYNWGDPFKTNQTQFIISDTVRWTSKKKFFNKTAEERDNIGREISRTGKNISRNFEKYYIVSPDSYQKGKSYCYGNQIEYWKRKGILDEKVVIHCYHRDRYSRGIELIKSLEKGMLEYQFGRPLIPENSHNDLCFFTSKSRIFDYLSEGARVEFKNDLYFSVYLNNTYKKDDEHSSYINRIGRIKDKNGMIKNGIRRREDEIKKTIIINIGFKSSDTKELLSNTSGRPFIITPFREGQQLKDSPIISRLIKSKPIEYWGYVNMNNKWGYISPLEYEIPLLAYIINRFMTEEKISGWDIIKGKEEYDIEKLTNIVLKHKELLLKFGVVIKKTNRGISFEKVKRP